MIPRAAGYSTLTLLILAASCGEKQDAPRPDALAPGRGGAGQANMGDAGPSKGIKLDEARRIIGDFTTSDQFRVAFADYPERKGVWSVADNFDIVFERFFHSWFATDPQSALEAARAIPLTDGRNRFEALAWGASRALEMPDEYFSTVIGSLPASQGLGLVGTATSIFVREDPERCFEFIDTKLGQGRAKSRALDEFFSRISGLDFRQAVHYARRLEFEEDRNSAYDSFMFPVKPPSAEDLAWAREQGVPEWALDKLMSKKPTPPEEWKNREQ